MTKMLETPMQKWGWGLIVYGIVLHLIFVNFRLRILPDVNFLYEIVRVIRFLLIFSWVICSVAIKIHMIENENSHILDEYTMVIWTLVALITILSYATSAILFTTINNFLFLCFFMVWGINDGLLFWKSRKSFRLKG